MMKLQEATDDVRNQWIKCAAKTPVGAVLFLFFTLVGLHLDSGQLQAATVDIHPGDNIPNIVNNNPRGTTFVIYSGLYRLQAPINAKDGDSFIGQTACAPPQTPCPAILNGARLLTSFQRSGEYYYVGNQKQQGNVTITSKKCEPQLPGYPNSYPGCIYPEDLYF